MPSIESQQLFSLEGIGKFLITIISSNAHQNFEVLCLATAHSNFDKSLLSTEEKLKTVMNCEFGLKGFRAIPAIICWDYGLLFGFNSLSRLRVSLIRKFNCKHMLCVEKVRKEFGDIKYWI